MNLVLYTYWRSSSAYRVRIALAYKQLAYEAVYVNLLQGAQVAPAYRQTNPIGHVPALAVDGRVFVESVAIVELLEELQPTPPLYPRDPFARARVRALVETVNAATQPLQNLNVLQRLSEDKPARAEWARYFIGRGLDAFEAHMERNAAEGLLGAFSFGDSLTAADCWLVPQLYNARRFSVDLTRYPRILAAEKSALAVDAVKGAAPENQPDAVPGA